MGNLRNMSAELIANRLDILETAGWTQKHWEALTEENAGQMLQLLQPDPIVAEIKGMDTDSQIQRIIAWYASFGKTRLLESDIRKKLPERPRGFDRLIWVDRGMHINQCYKALERQFGSDAMWKSDEDLSSVIESVRTADEPYGIWVRDRQEADEENANKSADQFEQKDCETVEERLIHEGLYFQEHKKHLDVDNVTLCAGSRNRDSGDVPSVDFDSTNRQVNVRAYWYSTGSRHPGLRVRSVRTGK